MTQVKYKYLFEDEWKEVTADSSETLLDMARNRDLRAPHACTEGGCGSCRGLLVQGKVEMAGNNVLSEEELKSGLILTCQSKATTPEVVVNFDCVG